MRYFPFFHDLHDKCCLLVGGGTIALRKARLLVKAGARLRVVAPSISPELKSLVLESGGECLFEAYCLEHLDGAVLVISATDIDTVNEQVADDCHRQRLPVNVVDNPSFIAGSVDRKRQMLNHFLRDHPRP